MKKLTVLISMLLVILVAGRGLALAEGTTDTTAKVKKPCKVNFQPGNKKHTGTTAPVPAK